MNGNSSNVNPLQGGLGGWNPPLGIGPLNLFKRLEFGFHVFVGIIERCTEFLGGCDLGNMLLDHDTINVIHDAVHDAKEMDIHDSGLSDANSATDGLVNDGGIPVLGEKENTATELQIQSGSSRHDLYDDDESQEDDPSGVHRQLYHYLGWLLEWVVTAQSAAL